MVARPLPPAATTALTLAHVFDRRRTLEDMARRAEPITKRTAKNGTVTYEFRLDLGTRPDGGRDRRRFTYRTMAEARREYRKISAEVAAGTYVPGHATTVGEFINSWLDGRRDIRPATLAGYRHALQPVIDRLGELRLQRLTRRHVDDLVEWRMSTGRTVRPDLSSRAQAVLEFVTACGPDGCTYRQVEAEFGVHGPKQLDRLRTGGYVERPARGRYVAAASPKAGHSSGSGVSARTVNAMLTQLSAALDDAMAEGLITRNVARLVERPKTKPTEMKAWTPDQASVFRAQVAGRRDYALWLLTLAGLRRSEVLGLAWKSVDLDAGTIAIVASRVPVPGGTDLGDPKSWRSHRILALPPDVTASLRAFKTAQARERLVIGPGWPDSGLVAVNADGTEIRPETYSAEFARIVHKSAGLPKIRLHDVRHTAASTLIAAGLSPVAAAAWLGHDPALTLRVYAHAHEAEMRAAGAALLGEGAP